MIDPRSLPPTLSDPEWGNGAPGHAQGSGVAMEFSLNVEVAPSRHTTHNAAFCCSSASPTPVQGLIGRPAGCRLGRPFVNPAQLEINQSGRSRAQIR